MPAGLAAPVRLALASAVGGVDFIQRREDQERPTVKVHVGVFFNLRFGLSYGRLPPAIAGNFVESLLRHLPHLVLVYAHHLRFYPLRR